MRALCASISAFWSSISFWRSATVGLGGAFFFAAAAGFGLTGGSAACAAMPHSPSAKPRTSALLRRERAPGLVRVVDGHLLELLEGGRTEVLLVHDSRGADDERLDAGHLVVRRRRRERESADHRALDHVVHRPHRCRGSLTLEHLVVVAVVRLELVRVALGDDARDPVAHRPLPGSAGGLPRQAVMLARR